jgi:NAD(P)-dependent dehydrogenase (short-subunit alcohol dehydrogenase family)
LYALQHVAILDIDVKGGKAFESQLASEYGTEKVNFYKCDVTTDELTASFDEVLKQQGYIDVVVNCAGIMNDKIYAKSIAINVVSILNDVTIFAKIPKNATN